MASEIKKYLKKGAESLTNAISENIQKEAKEDIDVVMDKIEERLVRLEGSLIQNAVALFILMAGIVLLIISGFHLMQDYFGASEFVSYLILAIIFIVIGYYFLKKHEPVFKPDTH